MTRARNPAVLVPMLLALLALAANLTLLSMRRTATVVNGDEGTFLAMAASLALDGDLEFAEADAARLEGLPRSGRTDLILQTTDDGIRYSKPVVYPLLAAPFFRVLGDSGLVVLNALAVAAALGLAFLYLRARNGPVAAGLVVVTFAGTSVLPAYVAWTMSDALQVSFVLAGAALCLGAGSGPRPAVGRMANLLGGPAAVSIGSVLLGLAAAMRYPNALVGAAVMLALAWERRPGKAVLALALLLAGVGLGLGLNRGLGGAAVPYKTLRATFTPVSGYPVGAGAEQAMEQFRAGEATQRVGLRPRLLPAMTAWSSLYFLVGRHTGLLVYFPFALFLVAAALRRPDARSLLLAAAAGGMAAFYLVWLPWNYFGGATFLGNRYFLTGYAVLLLAPQRSPGRRASAGCWLLALVALASALVSISDTRDRDATSQNHAYAGIFRLLPYETTARDLDGRRDRYWSDEFLRFVDPYAAVGRHGFGLSADSRAAEVVSVNDRDFGVLRFLVGSTSEGTRLIYRDWLKEESFELGRALGGFGGIVEVLPSRSLRRHSVWWDESGDSRQVRVFRLTLEGPPDAEAQVGVAGPYRFVPRFYRGEAGPLTLGGERPGASSETVRVEVRNAGFRHWDSRDDIPIHLGYSLYRLPRAAGDEPLRSRLTALPVRMERGQSAAVDVEVRWPSRPGGYEVVFDLAAGGVVWFREWCGAPLAEATVEIVPPAEEREGPSSSW